MGEFQDKEVRCIEASCKKYFTITAGEQEFFAGKGFQLPRRCKDCRERRKREQNGY